MDNKMEFDKELVLNALRNNTPPPIIKFEKSDGTIREMLATLNQKYIPLEEEVAQNRKQKKKPNPNIQVVYDIEKSGFRSFHWDSLVDVDYQTAKNVSNS